MPDYQGIYASPSGPNAGLSGGFLPGGSMTPGQWVTPPTGTEANQGYYWDWSTLSYKKGQPGQQGIGLPVSTATRTLASTAPAGVQVPYSNRVINPNDPTQRYQAVSIVKSPAIANASGDLLSSFKKGADSSMQDFSAYLSNFKDALGGAMKQSATATDINPAVGALNSRQAAYDAALNKAMADYEALNKQTAATNQGIVQQAQDLIPMYDKAAQDAVRQQLGALQAEISRYKSVSGTPMSLGSSELAMLGKGAAQILVPMEQAKIQQRYNVLGQYALPVAMDIANREQARIGTFNPAVAAQQFQSGQATAQTIHQLQVIASHMSRQDAVAFLQALAVPAQLQQQILSGQIQQLGALGQIEDQSYYRGLQDVLGANPSQPTYTPMGTGPYPNMGRYEPVQRGFGGFAQGQPNQGQVVDPNAPQPTGGPKDWVWDAGNSRWVNKFTGKVGPQPLPRPEYYGPTGNEGVQSNSFYDTGTGQTYDRYSGAQTSGANQTLYPDYATEYGFGA